MFDSEDSGWNVIFFGVACLVLAVIEYWYFSHLEATGGTGSAHFIIAALYNLGGKWLTCAILVLLGIVTIAKGIKDIREDG